MKNEAKKVLIKDLTTAGIAWVVSAVVFAMTGMGVFGGIILGIFMAGLPFGWRWLSKLITACNFQGLLIKTVLSMVLGWLAIFIILVKDIIVYNTAEDDEPVLV